VGLQNCTLWQSFGLSVGLCGFANVCNVGGVSFFSFVGGKKKQNNFHQICNVLSKKILSIFNLSLSYLYGRLSFYTCCQRSRHKKSAEISPCVSVRRYQSLKIVKMFENHFTPHFF
jgi:hypothetical protein